ncbi:ATP-binding protein [Rubrivivax sp. RP6-9]|uniref:ATP-binding protein n=1 Tax=Rubrivivax sp. RP6-9 TaxID=3415750 RepID=UPI003CC5E063
MELRFGPFTLLPAQRVLLEAGQPLRLGSRAFDLLVLLVSRAGEVVPNAELLAAAWPNRVVEDGSLRVHIAALRKALGEGHQGQRYISNVPLRGYCFVAPVESHAVPDAVPPSGGPVPPAAPASGMRHALPVSLTRVIGRDAVVAELAQRLREHRCVSIVGAGGIGKTTVAMALARAAGEGADGGPAVVVELAALEDGQLVPAAVASALGLVLPAASPLDALANFLRTRERLLLVLDNCEHLVGAVAELAEHLLLQAPGLRLLATSREALRIRGEWVHRLPSLPVPGQGGNLAEALGSPAVQLFVERAAAGSGSFALRDEDAPLVVELCRRLDGIPLAIELAAAAVEQFGLRGLAEQLGAHLSMLSRGRRTAMPRHQTLRATLDWSHALLTPAEQALLPRLSLFRGPFTRGAAQALAGDDVDVDEALAGLVGKSMVVADIGGEQVRYGLLETTRAYAAEHVARAGQAHALAARHAAWVLELIAAGDGGGAAPGAGWLAAQAPQVDDLRAAVAWGFSADGDLSLAITLAARSAPLWFAQSLMDEYRRLAEQALAAIEQRPTTDPEDTMRLCEAYGHALWHTRGGGPAMAASFRRALQIAEELDATPYKLRCMWGLWLICNTTGDYAGSAALAERFGVEVAGSADVATLLTHDRMMALGLHFHGEQRRARSYAERVLEHPLTINHTARHSGFQFDQRVAALTVMARISWVHGQPETALARARAAVQEAIAIDHSLSLCYAIANGAAPVAFWVGDIALARELTGLLQQKADERSLHFWQAFAGAYRLLLDLHDLGEQAPSRDALHRPGVALLLRETLASVNPCLFDDELRARARAGRSGWCLPEMLRLDAEQRRAAGAPAAEVHALLEQAVEVAAGQGALSWQLRCATSLARLQAAMGEGPRAARGLEAVLALFDEGADTADHLAARRLLSAVKPAAAAAGAGADDKA